MNGKKLKVTEYNLTFGSTDRYVNVFGFFKYKKNGNLYVVYTDVDMKYELVYYGSSHEKNNNLLSMSCKEEEQEIIKEYIYKVTTQESLDDFIVFSLEDITGIEIISSNKLEVQLDIIRKLEDLTIESVQKKEEAIEQKTTNEQKKTKKGIKIILILLIIVLFMGGGYFFLTTNINSNKIVKTISCTITTNDNKINAILEENNTYSFSNNNKLQFVEGINLYTFNEQEDYENFINNGTVFDYMPEFAKSYTPNNDEFTIKYETRREIDSSYQDPTEYEELIAYYKNRGYVCSEQIIEE